MLGRNCLPAGQGAAKDEAACGRTVELEVDAERFWHGLLRDGGNVRDRQPDFIAVSEDPKELDGKIEPGQREENRIDTVIGLADGSDPRGLAGGSSSTVTAAGANSFRSGI